MLTSKTLLAIFLTVSLINIWLPCVRAEVETEPEAEAEINNDQSNAITVVPSDTDPRITSVMCGAGGAHANFPHIAWLPTGKSRHQLLVHLVGTGGHPGTGDKWAALASSLGYHVIDLIYPNDMAAQPNVSHSMDPNAYLKFRLGIIRGGQITPGKAIAPPNSIENRLFKLLKYLDAHYPDAGWNQFLNANKIAWGKIAVSGMSQGGGHAAMIGKIHKVARVIMFSSPKDFSHAFNHPAKGFDTNTKTPLDRYFAFNHMRDNGHGCTHDEQVQIFKQMGLDKLGIANADTSSPNYNHAHLIYTDELEPRGHGFRAGPHSATVRDRLKCSIPVWTYMLTEPVK